MKSSLWLIFFVSYCCHSQEPDLTKWKQDTLPLGDRVFVSNHSDDNWIFKPLDGVWTIVQNDFSLRTGDSLPFPFNTVSNDINESIGHKSVKKVDDGYIVCFAPGEAYDAGLYFIFNDGTVTYPIAEFFQIMGIFEFNNRMFALEGSGHGFANRGRIIEIYIDTTWKQKRFQNFDSAPETFTIFKNQVFIVTAHYILILDASFKLTKLLTAPFYWGLLYPSSVLASDRSIFVAMREGVLKIVDYQFAPRFEWYVPPKINEAIKEKIITAGSQ